MRNFLLHVLHCILSNGSRVCKSDEGLMSAFKMFIFHAGHCDSSSFFPLKHATKQFKQNLCSYFNTYYWLFQYFPTAIAATKGDMWINICVINIIQFHFRWNVIRYYLRTKGIKKTLSSSRIFDITFWSAFLSTLYFKHSFANNPFLE